MSKVKVIDLIKYISSCGQDEIELNSITEHFKDKPEEEQKLPKPKISSNKKDEETLKPYPEYSLKYSNNFSKVDWDDFSLEDCDTLSKSKWEDAEDISDYQTSINLNNASINLHKVINTYYDKNNEIIEEQIPVPYLEISDEDKEEIRNIVEEKQMAIEALRAKLDLRMRRKYLHIISKTDHKIEVLLKEFSEKFKSDFTRLKTDGDIFITNRYKQLNYLKTDKFMSEIYINPFVYKMFQKENEKLLWHQRIKMLEKMISSNPDIAFNNRTLTEIKCEYGEQYCEGLFRILEHYFNKKLNRNDKDLHNHLVNFIESINTTQLIKFLIADFVSHKLNYVEYKYAPNLSVPIYAIKDSIFENVNLEDFSDKVISEIENRFKNGHCSYRKIISVIDDLIDTITY